MGRPPPNVLDMVIMSIGGPSSMWLGNLVRANNAPEIPDEELQEATDGRLAEVEEINIYDMIGGGGSKGKKKTGPRQKRETVGEDTLYVGLFRRVEFEREFKSPPRVDAALKLYV